MQDYVPEGKFQVCVEFMDINYRVLTPQASSISVFINLELARKSNL